MTYPRTFVLDKHTGSIKHRALDSYERRGGIFMTAKSTHFTWDEAHRELLAHRQKCVANAEK